jgi:hypothetical protein
MSQGPTFPVGLFLIGKVDTLSCDPRNLRVAPKH